MGIPKSPLAWSLAIVRITCVKIRSKYTSCFHAIVLNTGYDFPCIAEQNNAAQNVSVATEKLRFATQFSSVEVCCYKNCWTIAFPETLQFSSFSYHRGVSP